MLATARARWWALLILCLGALMNVLDTTIVNVALPSIRVDLGFNESALVWVVNAYMLTFSGFLLLGGRLGDLYGYRRLFLIGIAIFTIASLTCGVASSQLMLIAARAVQGIGGAIVNAVALSLIVNLFPENNERARAMGFFGFVAAGGGAIGVFLGGVLTGAFNWHWVFLVNVPIGIVVFVACLMLLPASRGPQAKLDIFGAILITAALVLAVYAIVGGNAAGWLTLTTLGTLAAAIVLFALFIILERRIREPLVPLDLFRRKTVLLTSVIGILWSAAMFTWFFLSALYMQLVLGYTPFLVGLAFLPGNIIMAAFSVSLSAKVIDRFGTKGPLAIGMALVALGLTLFALAPITGTFWFTIFPAMCVLGVGAGLAFNPVLLIGMSEVPQDESGLASGVLNTAFMMGGSLGLAVLASVASAVSIHSSHAGAAGLLDGYHIAFGVGALSALLAAIVALTIPHVRR
jgi:EmrB/QacA subfamily drug resistance transporter